MAVSHRSKISKKSIFLPPRALRWVCRGTRTFKLTRIKFPPQNSRRRGKSQQSERQSSYHYKLALAAFSFFLFVSPVSSRVTVANRKCARSEMVLRTVSTEHSAIKIISSHSPSNGTCWTRASVGRSIKLLSSEQFHACVMGPVMNSDPSCPLYSALHRQYRTVHTGHRTVQCSTWTFSFLSP